MTRVVLPLVAAAALAACVPSSTQCRADDECDEGLVCAAGRCSLPDDVDAGDEGDGEDAGAPGDDDAGEDAGTTTEDDGGTPPVDEDAGVPPVGDDAGPTGPGPVVDDGVLQASELPLALGVQIRFVEAASDAGVPVDLQGQAAADGVVEWRFDQPLPGDARITVEAEPLDGKWFADAFPDATYTAKLGDGAAYGAFARDETGVRMLGVASVAEDETLLTYDQPLEVLRYPLSLGATWTSTVESSGRFEGNDFYRSTDSYETTIDAAGRVITEAGAFDVLRLRVLQTVEVPVPFYPFLLEYRWVRYSFVTACYGEVAHVDSAEGEEDVVFDTAARVRRIGLGP